MGLGGEGRGRRELAQTVTTVARGDRISGVFPLQQRCIDWASTGPQCIYPSDTEADSSPQNV